MVDFTDQQIQSLNDAWFKLWPTSIGNFDQLKEEITRTKSVFKAGEVVMCSNQGEEEWPYIWDERARLDASVRRPSPEEVPALKLALERLEDISNGNMGEIFCEDYAQTALDEIKAMI